MSLKDRITFYLLEGLVRTYLSWKHNSSVNDSIQDLLDYSENLAKSNRVKLTFNQLALAFGLQCGFEMRKSERDVAKKQINELSTIQRDWIIKHNKTASDTYAIEVAEI